jgi:transposase-like protein
VVNYSHSQCSEALLNNEKCFLDDPSWAKVFMASSVPDETFTDRSNLGIELIMLKAKLSGLAKRTNHAVAIQDALQPQDFEAIAAELRVVRSAVVAWRRTFNTALIHTEERSRNDTMDFGKRYELLGISLVVNIILSRLLCSIVPNDRALLEEEVQNLAAEMEAVQESLEHNQRAKFFFAQKSKTADAAIATHPYFRDVLYSGKVVELWRLEKFFEAMGRKCCNGETCCDLNRW